MSAGKERDAHALHDPLQQRGSRAGADVTGPATASAPTDAVAGPPVLCKCGHDLDAHSGTGVAGVSCKTCYQQQLGPPHVCWGWESQFEQTEGGDDHADSPVVSQQRGSGADVTGPATAFTYTGAVAGPPVLCKCGHDLDAHMGSGIAGVPCTICGPTSKGLPTGNCMGWDPTGTAAAPPDLAHAIQAPKEAMSPAEAAEYVLALKDCTPFLKQRAACDQAAEALAQLQATRDQLAGLEVYAAELHDLLEEVARPQPWGDFADRWTPLRAKIQAALQADPPARGRAILDEVERLRVYQRALALQVLAYRRALDTTAERNALQGLVGIVDGFEETALDLGVAQEEDSG